MSDLSVFDNKINENGILYYNFPSGYPLFKANKLLNQGPVITLLPNVPYFFGLKNMNPEYISSYEDEYGVIFEFVTTRPYKLLALDDKKTQEVIYSTAPNNIKSILERNYGYNNGNRDSVSESDRILSDYLCKNGYEGYAIHNMQTDMGGKFHDELMICNADGVQYVKQVTPDSRVNNIIESGKLKSLSKSMKNSRKQNRMSIQNNNEPVKKLFSDDNNDNDNKPVKKLLFDDDDDFNGGRKSKKNKKTKKNQIKKVKNKRKTKKSQLKKSNKNRNKK